MSRIPAPTNQDAPAGSRPLLRAFEDKLGHISNFLRVMANSPVVLEGYFSLAGSLNNGSLTPITRERIALAVSEFNGCEYSLSAHTYVARKVLKLDDAEITANRNGGSNDPKAEAAVQFALTVARQHGHVSQKQFDRLKAAGYDSGQVVEIVHHVVFTTFSNYLNKVAETDIDFPVIQARPAAPSAYGSVG